jgi:hypothetical protein
METKFNMDDPAEWEKDWLAKIRSSYTELKRTHAGRAKRPLKFVEEFEVARKRVRHFENSGWESVEKERGYVVKLLERFQSDYERCVPSAERQRERKEMWDEIYNPPPPFLPGGKADGNSR